MKIDYTYILDKLIELSWKASDCVFDIYNESFDITLKMDGSPVTAADIASHKIIIRGLSQLTPYIPIVSEEDIEHHFFISNIFWLVDPLDGTKEFINRNGEFTVNIALIVNGQPVLGVVCAPALQVSYGGIVGLGAFKIYRTSSENKIPIQVALKNSTQHKALKVVGSRSHGNSSLVDEYLSQYSNTEFIAVGSSLKFCYIAEGIAHIYPRLGRTMEWDTAAGQAVLVAAGGCVLSLDGEPLMYGKGGFENPHFIAQACFVEKLINA